MIVTEAEARNRECRQIAAALVPMKSQGAIALQAPQQMAVGYGQCSGSKCMGWRWAASQDKAKQGGYCGFAGEPQYARDEPADTL